MRRSSGDVDATAAAVHAHVRSNPGQGVIEIGDALGLSAKDLRLPVKKLLEEGKLKTTGQRRGTKYHPGAGRKRAATKTSAKRKTSKRKAGKRKAKKTK